MAANCCGSCSKCSLLFLNLFYWCLGLAILIYGIWMLVDPRRSYLLDVVNFIEEDPLLKTAAYIFVAVGCVTVVVTFIGCCGAIRESPCMLTTFALALSLLVCAEIAAAILCYLFREKFTVEYTQVYLGRIAKERYGRDPWATPFFDTMQFYTLGAEMGDGFRDLIQQKYGSDGDVTEAVDKTQLYGCAEPLADWLHLHIYIFIGLALIAAITQMIGIGLSICLCLNVNRKTRVDL